MIAQHEYASQRASRVTQYRAKTRREFREAGTVGALNIVADLMHFGQPQMLTTLPVGDLLAWVPKIRKQRAVKMCRRAGVAYDTPLGQLASWHRRAILHQVLTWKA